jgi:hypothetical protein
MPKHPKKPREIQQWEMHPLDHEMQHLTWEDLDPDKIAALPEVDDEGLEISRPEEPEPDVEARPPKRRLR